MTYTDEALSKLDAAGLDGARVISSSFDQGRGIAEVIAQVGRVLFQLRKDFREETVCLASAHAPTRYFSVWDVEAALNLRERYSPLSHSQGNGSNNFVRLHEDAAVSLINVARHFDKISDAFEPPIWEQTVKKLDNALKMQQSEWAEVFSRGTKSVFGNAIRRLLRRSKNP